MITRPEQQRTRLQPAPRGPRDAVAVDVAPRVRRSAITLRSAADIEGIRAAGVVVRGALDAARRACMVGATTRELDRAACRVIADAGGEALFLHYPTGSPETGFPATVCTSVNEEIVHGIPGERRLCDGDLVSIDCGVRLEGWCADAAITVAVGQVESAVAAMVTVAEDVLATAIALAQPGRRWSDVAAVLERRIVEAGYGLIEGYVGHGIGRNLHEAPEVPCHVVGDRHVGHDFTIRPGMVIAIEPMFALRPTHGDRFAATVETEDGWTVRTLDRCTAVHVEHTIAVTRDGALILTR